MTWPLVKLHVPLEVYEAMKRRLTESGEAGQIRIDSPTPGHLNLDGVALEVDPNTVKRTEWSCCGLPRDGGHNSSCTFYGLDEKK
jgi:hypothetical protein